MSRNSAIWFLLGLTVAGFGLRVLNLGERPFWRDEACVAELVQRLAIGELLHQSELPLPPGFAALLGISSSFPGRAEWKLRLPVALLGSFAPLLAYWTGRNLRWPRGLSLFVAALTAGCASLVVFSRELKQYGLEAILALAVAGTCAWLLRVKRTQQVAAPGGTLIALCAIAPWLGYAALFPAAVLIPFSAILALRRATSAKSTIVFCIAALLVLAWSSGYVWVTATAGQSASPALRTFMSPWFIDPLDLHDWTRAASYGFMSLVLIFGSVNWLGGGPLEIVASVLFGLPLIGLALWGVLSAPRGTRAFLAMWLLGPLVLMLVAACFKRYPFGVFRMMQVAGPPLTLAVGCGAYALLRTSGVCGRAARMARLGGLGLIVASSGVISAVHAFTFDLYIYHDFPTILDRLRNERLPGEWVIADGTSSTCVRYYAPMLEEPHDLVQVLAGTIPPPNDDFHARVLARLRERRQRAWWITTSEAKNQGRPAFEAEAMKSGYRFRSVVRAGARDGAPGGAAELIEILPPGAK